MRNSSALAPLLVAAISPALTNCATIATCPGNLLPVVEIQVNNTASNHDDYGSTSATTTCRARIANATGFNGAVNFPGGVTVELRNTPGVSNVLYGPPGGTATAASMFQTLPGNGGWQEFVVQGAATSGVDKSSTIEMSTSGTCDEVVLARKAMMFPSGAAPIPATPARPRVELEIGSISTLDDYLGWTPMFGRIRWADGTAAATLNVTLRNAVGADHLRFGNNGTSPANDPTRALTLNGAGDWVTFYVAGNFASPSTNDKDAILEVIDTSTNNLLSREGLMVRVRKNANNLSAGERDRYLEALRKMNLTFADYIDFVRTHSRDGSTPVIGHRQAHSGTAFMPWHRVFLLNLERILQAADPSVALPYWKFDANAPNMFTQDFMGANSAGNFATLAGSNPIIGWSLAGEGVAAGIQRQTPYGDGGHPATDSELTTLALGGAGATFGNFTSMELTTHNPAHSRSGFQGPTGAPTPSTSWVASSPSIATRDPLFFFLHCNIDRLWAKWQWVNDRNSPTDINAYNLQGSHNAPAAGVPAPQFTQSASGQITSNRTLGQYAEDSMWPWDNVTGSTAGTGTLLRPAAAILTPLPIPLTWIMPGSKPRVRDVIDPHPLGVSYDDVFPY